MRTQCGRSTGYVYRDIVSRVPQRILSVAHDKEGPSHTTVWPFHHHFHLCHEELSSSSIVHRSTQPLQCHLITAILRELDTEEA